MHYHLSTFLSSITKNGKSIFLIIILITFVQYVKIETAFFGIKSNNQSQIYWNANDRDLNKHIPKNIQRNQLHDANVVPQTVYHKWKWRFPCFPGKNFNGRFDGEKLRGFIYVKVPKTGSSTLSGINLRISIENYALKPDTTTTNDEDSYKVRCAGSHYHYRAEALQINLRKRDYTYLWTFVRNPTSQFISAFFHFRVTRGGYAPTYENLKEYVDDQYTIRDYPQISFISPKAFTTDKVTRIMKGNATERVQDILNEYDFIGVSERFDESLVVLRLLLDLNADDILYVPSKLSGGWDDGMFNATCYKIMPSFTTPAMKEYFSSDHWLKLNEVSFLLHKAANKSLDLTIQIIGQEIFDKALSEHKYLMSLVQSTCTKSRVSFPCSNDGVLQLEEAQINCYWKDAGCGYPCINEMYSKLVENNTQFQVEKKFNYKSLEGGEKTISTATRGQRKKLKQQRRNEIGKAGRKKFNYKSLEGGEKTISTATRGQRKKLMQQRRNEIGKAGRKTIV